MKESLDGIDGAVWKEFIQYRRMRKAPMVESTKDSIIQSVRKYEALGADPNALLQQTMDRGWIGVFNIKHEPEDEAWSV